MTLPIVGLLTMCVF